MYRALKVLHLLGLALFLGSVLAHVSVNAIPNIASDPTTLLIGRQAIEAATRFVTLPGLVLAIVSGVGLTLVGRHGFGRRRWLTLHQAIGLLILLNALLFLAPIGREAEAAARALVAGSGAIDAVLAIAGRERVFGPINVVLTLATIVLAVFRPRLGQGAP